RSRALVDHTPPGRGEGGSALLRHRPLARRPARLLEAAARGPGPLRRERRLRRPGNRARFRAAPEGPGQAARLLLLPGHRPRVLEPPPPRRVPRGALRDGLASLDRLLTSPTRLMRTPV